MHRLYPAFVGGSGSVGLLVLRLVAGTAMMARRQVGALDTCAVAQEAGRTCDPSPVIPD